MAEPWANEVVEVEWKSYECLGHEEATRKMNELASSGAKMMQVHFVGLGQLRRNTAIMANQIIAVPIFIVFALEPVKKPD